MNKPNLTSEWRRVKLLITSDGQTILPESDERLYVKRWHSHSLTFRVCCPHSSRSLGIHPLCSVEKMLLGEKASDKEVRSRVELAGWEWKR